MASSTGQHHRCTGVKETKRDKLETKRGKTKQQIVSSALDHPGSKNGIYDRCAKKSPEVPEGMGLIVSTKSRTTLRRLNRAAEEAGSSVPLERLLHRHLDDLKLLRASGLTWSAIAKGLTGWRQKSGGPITPDQLRSSFSRASRGTLYTGNVRRSVGAPLTGTGVSQAVLPTAPPDKQDRQVPPRAVPTEPARILARLRSTAALRGNEEEV